MSSQSQWLEKVKLHTFFYNPRDTERILNIILGEKQLEETKKNEILKAYKRGVDYQYFNANLPYFHEIKFISKITSFKVKDDLIIAKFQNGFTGEFDPHQIADNPDDFYNLITSYMFVKIKKSSQGWYISDIFSIEPQIIMKLQKNYLNLQIKNTKLMPYFCKVLVMTRKKWNKMIYF